MKDETILLQQLNSKSEKALKEAIERYTPYISTIIRKKLLGKATAEDIEEVVADTFIALWKSANHIDYKSYSSLKAYIGMIARNKAKDWLRHYNGEELVLYENAFLVDAGVEVYVIEKEQSKFVQELLLNLNTEDQQIFILHYYQYKEVKEIAGILDMNIQTVKSRLRRGRMALRKLLEDEGYYSHKNES